MIHKDVIFVGKRPYLFHTTISSLAQLHTIRKKYPKNKYFWIRKYDRRGRVYYKVYLAQAL